MKFHSITGAMTIVAMMGLGGAKAAEREFYRLESAQILKSPNAPDWDYITLDAQRSHLFIARVDDGILVYDVNARKPVKTLEQSEGGNATTLIPDLDRGFVIKEDGTALAFKLSTLTLIGGPLTFGKSADNAFYDPVTQQLLVTMGDDQLATLVDAKTGTVAGTLAIDSKKIEGSAPDGKGNYFVALRDRNKVITIDARQRKIKSEWATTGCELPTGLAFDKITQRIFVGCRGDRPVLAVMDATSGKVIATQAIGRGSDGVVFDSESRLIYSSNGYDGTLVVIQQVNADTYKLSEAITTRPFARTMALDPETKKVFLVTAEGAVDPSQKRNPATEFYPNVFFKDTFTLLTYSRQKP